MAPKYDEEFPRERNKKLFGASHDAHFSSPFPLPLPFLRLDTRVLYCWVALFSHAAQLKHHAGRSSNQISHECYFDSYRVKFHYVKASFPRDRNENKLDDDKLQTIGISSSVKTTARD